MNKKLFTGLLTAACVVIIMACARPCYASGDKVIALTYDDGPHAKYTPMILDLLKKYNARATFFPVGERAEKFPDIVSRTFNEGHSLGNHTYNHTELTQLCNRDILSQITKTNKVIEDITGTRPVLLRPPEGGHSKRTDSLIGSLNMYTVLWNVDPLDWYHKDAQRTYNSVLKTVKSGDIILLHDFYQNTVMATEKILPALQAQGYRFVTVEELLGARANSGGVYYSQSQD